MSKGLALSLLLTSVALAQGSDVLSAFVESPANFNAVKSVLENQQEQPVIAAARAAAGEARAKAEFAKQEMERMRLGTLRESQRAQQVAEDSKRSAGLEPGAKSRDAEIGGARRQLRIEHLKVLALAAREKHADFDETVNRFNCPIRQAMNEAILDSDSGAEIIYWLGKHATECRLIADLQPLAAVREIGRIEGTIAPLHE